MTSSRFNVTRQGTTRSLRAYIAVSPQIHCNPLVLLLYMHHITLFAGTSSAQGTRRRSRIGGVDTSFDIPQDDSSVCAVILGVGVGDRHRQLQLATRDIPTLDSSGCAVSLGHGGDPRLQSQLATRDIPTEDSSGCAVSLGDDGDRPRQSQLATRDIPTEDSSRCAVSLGGDDRSRQSLADVDAFFNMLMEDSSKCAVSVGGSGGDCRHQSQVAARDVPTEDSSGCAVSLGGDDGPRQSLAGVVDAFSACLQRTAQGVQLVSVMAVILAVSYSQLLATFQQRTARDVLSVFVVMTDHISH